MIMPVCNIVATTDLTCKLDLHSIHQRIPESEYNPKKFSGLVVRIKNPKATALFFKTGKMVCLGTRTLKDLDAAGLEFITILKHLGYINCSVNFCVQNMVASFDVGFKIDLEMMSSLRGAIFVPEIFPGLDFQIANAKLIIFHSGKLIITRTKSEEEINDAYDKIKPILKSFMRNKK